MKRANFSRTANTGRHELTWVVQKVDIKLAWHKNIVMSYTAGSEALSL